MPDTPPTSMAPPPPPLSTLDTEALRRKLAGLADPDRGPGAGEKAEIKELASGFCLALAQLFNRDSLDAVTLWERIGSGLATACAKVNDGDLDRLLSLCLDHVKADPGKAAAHPGVAGLLATFATRPPEWRFAFVDYLDSRKYVVLALGRARWEEFKATNGKVAT